ncbi:MAG: hypothetical protein C4527_26590 [Candidatus Omnitrophota bacterium]|jgi:hypothetical protein|nr:MAG: hypothetical protein C4527_26590 [Candidatus Omnitrophota bacterium]
MNRLSEIPKLARSQISSIVVLVPYSIIIIAIFCMAVHPAWGEMAGERIALVTGELIIPTYFQPQRGEIDLVFHLHCAPEAAGNSLIRSGINAVMIAVHIGSFSSPYQAYFSDPRHFHELLEQALVLLQDRFSDPALRWEHICVTAYSGGYGGAREFMRFDDIYNLIDSLILLDCPHTSYTEERRVNPEQIAGFLRYAQDASAGKKTFIMTHSEIVPGSYASTTECADYLIDAMKGMRTPWSGTNEMDMTHNSRFESGRFKIYGFKGDTAAEHMKHLHGLFLFLRQIDFDS